MKIPEAEQNRFVSMIKGQAQQFGISEKEYIRKVWYHENASKLGEYVAMVFADELLQLVANDSQQTPDNVS